MNNSLITIGFAMTGSFCTFDTAINQLQLLKNEGYNIVPIMSDNAKNIDTRFGKAKDFVDKVENICGKKIINSIEEAEPIGPKKMLDVLAVCPCTGNTLAKISGAITDNGVLMAVKSHLRIKRPLVLCIASNDALGASAQNIGNLINTKNIYFVPFGQDDPVKKENSLVADFSLLKNTIEHALKGKQLQPVIIN